MENGIITLPAFQTGFMIMFIGLAITVILSFFTQAERELID